MASKNRSTRPANPKASLDTHPTLEANPWSCTIEGLEADAYLRVIGASSLHVNGISVEVRPPLGHQVLLALALESSNSLSRSEVGNRLFSQLDKSRRGAQTRLVIQRLKQSLVDHGLLESILEVGEGILALKMPLQIDAEHLCSQLTSIEHLKRLSSPILPGHTSRYVEKYRNGVKNRIETALGALFQSLSTTAEIAEFIVAVESLRDNYQLSAPIRAHLCAAYQRLHRYDELTSEILHFESEWLDVFGPCDKPDIAALASQIAKS